MIQIKVAKVANVTSTNQQLTLQQKDKIKILPLSAVSSQLDIIAQPIDRFYFGVTVLHTCCMFTLHKSQTKVQFYILYEVFSFLIWSSIHQKFDIGQMAILIIFSLFGILFIAFAVYTYLVQIANTFSSRLMVAFLKFVIFFIVPFMEFHLGVIMSTVGGKVDFFFHTLSVVTLVFTTTFSLLFLKLMIKPFRKNNVFWRYTNQYEVERFILNIARTLVFVIDGISVVNLVLSLLLEVCIRIRIKKYHQIEYLLQINTGSYLILSAHLTLLCYKLTGNLQLSSKILISLLILSLLKGFHDYFHEHNKQLTFPVCSSTPYLFYDFYFKLYKQFHQKISSYSNSNEKSYQDMMKDHSRRCKAEVCPLREVCFVRKNILPQVESIVSELLNKNKLKGPDLQILEQLWNLERGKKFSFRQLQGKINLEVQFIIFTVKNNETKREVDSNIGNNFINSTNIQQNCTIFFDPLQSVLKNFEEFYTEILKPKPKIQTLTRVGERIRVQVQGIQELYMDLLKKKLLTFKAIELYIQFENYFLKCNSLSPQLLKKITIIQKSTKIDDIEQIYLPTINFYPESGLIEDINMECLSFLRYSRFQMKAKLIHDFILPSFKADSYFDLSQQQLQDSLMFIKKKRRQFACGNIRINVKFANNKRIFALVFQKKKKQQATNFILVDKNFDIVQMVTQFENFKDKKNSQNINITVIDWKDMFQKYLKPFENELKLTKLIKIDLKRFDSILMCTLNKTLNPDYSIVSLRIMKNLKDVVIERRSIVMPNGELPSDMGKKHKFYFEFSMDDDKFALLTGEKSKIVRQKKKTSNTQALDFLAHQLRRNLVSFALIKNRNFDKGIKTYRLIGQGLYNVDLQDKQAYLLEFDQAKRKSRKESQFEKNHVDVYIITLVIIIALILTGLSVYLLVSLQTNMSTINEYFSTVDEIHTFKLDFYRILATLRDVSSGLYESLNRDWVSDIMESYNNILSIQNQKMFSNNQVNMTYRSYNYTGNLNELLQVILSDVFTLTHDLQDTIIQEIHGTSILELTPLIELESDKTESQILEKLTMLASLKNWLGLGTIVGIIMFYVLIFYFCLNLVSRMKRNLSELMMISDIQAREGQQNAQKLIYVIEMSKKNFQIDFNNLLPPRKRFRPRKKQKKIIIGPNLKFFSIGSSLTLFIMNIMFIMAFYIVIESNFANFRTMRSQGETIISVYSDMCKQTNYIDHTSIINKTSIEEIRIQLQEIQAYFDELVFSDSTNTIIKTYFLSNSCPMIYQKQYAKATSNVTCEKATPGYQIDNPFTIGLLLYLIREHYQIINNLTDTFAATGIYSSIFSNVFIEMAKEISNDVTAILDSFIITIEVWCAFFIAVNIFYCLFAICMSIYVKKKGNSVQKLVKFLNLRKETQQKSKDHQHGQTQKKITQSLSIKQKNNSKSNRPSLRSAIPLS